MIGKLEYIADAIRGLLHIIEEHGTPVQMAHGRKLMKARNALFHLEGLISTWKDLFPQCEEEPEFEEGEK